MCNRCIILCFVFNPSGSRLLIEAISTLHCVPDRDGSYRNLTAMSSSGQNAGDGLQAGKPCEHEHYNKRVGR